MNRKTRVFISYKTGPNTGLTFQANAIRQKLLANDFEVWMDTESLSAGLEWDKQIYEWIPKSDILLLLLAGETAGSKWVQREVDIAKGAKVTILPVMIRGDFDRQEALDQLDISRIQFAKLLSGDEEEFGALIDAIDTIKDLTQERKVKWLSLLREGEQAEPHDPAKKSIAALTVGGRRIHLAGGNLMAMKGIDVVVNSENDYMQMARVFESRTISSMLRYGGSHIDRAQRLVADTVQDELNLRVKEFETRPVGKMTVIVTSAGHPESVLRKQNKARFIFHTATVSVQGDGSSKYLEPIVSRSGVTTAVRQTLDKIVEVDRVQGVVAREGTPLHAEQALAKAGYRPIKSIIFPAFGTGHGGKPLYEVAPLMIRGMKEFLLDHEDDADLALKDIYFCVYTQDDVALVKGLFEKLNGETGASVSEPAAE
jgi:O-acetyl-ADP-ribose deacetylase (regulator of RNase III)